MIPHKLSGTVNHIQDPVRNPVARRVSDTFITKALNRRTRDATWLRVEIWAPVGGFVENALDWYPTKLYKPKRTKHAAT